MVDGWLQTAGRSQRLPARLHVDAAGHTIIDGAPAGAFATLEVSTRIGNTRRFITLPDGASFESEDNDGIDALIARHRGRRVSLYGLESSLRLALTSVVVVAAAGWYFFSTGLPALSERMAHAVPASAVSTLGTGILRTLDAELLEPTTLADDKQAQLHKLFDALKPADSAFDLRLNLRAGGTLGANAFALPDGNIVLTDELVELVSSDAKIAAILQHEIGHVERRHSLQKIIRASATTAIVYGVTGDASGIAGLLASAPAVMLQLHYSREMETDADLYALQHLRAAGRDPHAMIHALEALHAEYGGAEALRYLSTHPLGDSRIAPLRSAIEGKP